MPVEAGEKAVEAILLTNEEKSEMATAIQDKFDSVFNAADDAVETPATPEKKPDPEPTVDEEIPAKTAEESKGEEKPVDEVTDEVTDDKTDEPVVEAAVDSTAPILPAAYRRSLKAYEWTDAEIEAGLKSGGAQFIQTASKLHATRNRELGEWAKLGREKKAETAATLPAPSSIGTAALPAINVEELKKEYGENTFFDKVVVPINQTIAAINSMLPAVQKSVARTQRSEAEALGSQIDGFFSGSELKDFAPIYGTKTATLTDAQLTERQKVLEHADALIGGAAMQGRKLTLEQALTLAVDSLTSGQREQTAREKIAASLKARQRGITLKPGARKTLPSGKQADPREALASQVKGKLAAMFPQS